MSEERVQMPMMPAIPITDYIRELHKQNEQRMDRLDTGLDKLRGLLWGILGSTLTLNVVIAIGQFVLGKH